MKIILQKMCSKLIGVATKLLPNFLFLMLRKALDLVNDPFGMNFEEEDKRIQKKIDWISRQIRETKILLHKQNQELQEAIKEQENLRKEKK